jgi:hypothetical protein
MNMKNISFILTIFAFLFFLSCEKNETGEPISATSTSLSNASHNVGKNCMTCHKSGGLGDGWFVVAGSVYNSTQTVPYITASVELRTAQSGGGTLVSKIEVDMNGNFYTTEPVDFGTGLYTSVVGGVNTKYMPGKVTDGACNSCHDASNRIWAE